MRILLVSSGVFEVPPKGGGAVERHIWSLAKILATRGHDVHIIARPSQGLDKAKGITFHRVRTLPFSFGSSFYGWLRSFLVGALSTFATILLMDKIRYSFDVVHAHDALSSIAILMARRHLFRGAAFVFTLHGYTITPRMKHYNGIKRTIMIMATRTIAIVGRFADKVIVFSNFQSKEASIYYSIPQGRLRVVPQTVDIPSSYEMPRGISNIAHWFPAGYCLFVGRLSSLKGVHILLRALVGRNVRCIIVGDGPEKENLETLSRNLGLEDRVTFAGLLPFDQVGFLYTRAAFFVLPTYAEGFPLVLLEAMAHGLPVITTMVCGIPEVVTDRVNGFLVSPGDILSLSEKIRILEAQEELRRRMGMNARSTIRTLFNSERIGETLESVYLEAIAN